jgi:MoxR-like ATPase
MHWASASKATARLNGRNYVSVEDVQEIAQYVLTHRLIMKGDTKPDEALGAAFEQVPVPKPAATFVYV